MAHSAAPASALKRLRKRRLRAACAPENSKAHRRSSCASLGHAKTAHLPESIKYRKGAAQARGSEDKTAGARNEHAADGPLPFGQALPRARAIAENCMSSARRPRRGPARENHCRLRTQLRTSSQDERQQALPKARRTNRTREEQCWRAADGHSALPY